jgi:hypothetical protein
VIEKINQKTAKSFRKGLPMLAQIFWSEQVDRSFGYFGPTRPIEELFIINVFLTRIRQDSF